MQWIRCAAAAVTMVASGVVPALASPDVGSDEVLIGRVLSASSRWTHDGSAIVTESVLATGGGQEVTVRQRGGSVGGVGMVVLHAPPVLRAGDRVTAHVDVTADLSGRASRSVRALYAAPGAAGGGRMPFVRTEATETRERLAWESGCAFIEYDAAGTTHVEGDLEFAVMDRSLAAWRDGAVACSYLELRRSETREDSEVGYDGVNLVKFREGRWCRPASQDEPEDCYSPDAAGLTTLFFVDDELSGRNGTILDADIELNAVDFSISVDGNTGGPASCDADLSNTFTHEVGHLIGLDHTCWSGGIRLEDDQGAPVPSCGDQGLPDDVREATMYSYQECGETTKATPEPDDIDGMCAIYPIADDPGECRAAGVEPGGCCSSAVAGGADRGRGGVLPVVGAALLFLLVARRRARRRGSGVN